MGFTLEWHVVVLLQVTLQYICGQELPVFRDDYTYVEQTHSFYKFHTTRSTWQEAVNTCGKEGATLYYPVNECEADIVLVHWSKTPAYGWAFVGISSLNKNVFEAIDGHAIWDVYNNWRPGEPNNANGKEACVVLLHDGTLNDVECSEKMPFICKKKLDSSKNEAICDRVVNTKLNVSFRNDYRYLEDTKKFYKIHTVYHKWQDAKEQCNKEEAVLFYPKNRCEANAVLEFWNATQPFDRVHVGISSSKDMPNEFQTVDGLAVWKVYNNWRPGEPNNEGGNEECVVLDRDGTLYDIRCDTNLPFICMKTIDLNKKNAVCDKLETDPLTLSNIRKDYKYFEDTQSLYKIHTIFQNQQNAKTICKSEEATLFYPQNECEANTVLTFWNTTQSLNQVYIGVYNPSSEASVLQFDTIDGRPIYEVYNNWRRGEPNNINGEENCVLLLREGTLIDSRCDIKNAFICKKNMSEGNAFCHSKENSKKFRKDYIYLDETQSFYKMHKNFLSWEETKRTCEREGAFLYYPENTCEANIVLKFWNKMQPSRRIYVGISSPSRGVFETVRGVPAWKVYSKWQPGEPNSAYEVENCVILHQDGLLLNDINCGKKFPFICKKMLKPRKSNHGCDLPNANDELVNSFRKDYIYLEDTQSLYKFHTIFDNFRGANRTCTMEGASLFYPENQCELNVVVQYWNTLPYITPVRVLDTAFVGRQEPDASNGCEVLFRYYANFTRRSCDDFFLFICKKVIETDNRDAFCDNPKTEVQAGNGFRSDYVYLNDTQSFYKFHKKAYNWQEANNICAREQATLFYPANKCEAKSVLNFWRKAQSFRKIFIGISSALEGIFETIDHKSIWDVYNNWRPGEPNNANGEEKCVVLLQDGTLNDVNCHNSYSFICKKEMYPRTGQTLCDQVQSDDKPGTVFRKDYKYLSDTQSFYKIHTLKHDWGAAKQICAQEDATLFYPENKCEANVILEFWNQTQPFNSIYVGISSLNKGVFETVTGRPVWDVYNNWRPGEPNNENENENCVELLRDGTFSDVQCSLSFPFICKKKMSSHLEIAICDKHENDQAQDFGYRKDYTYIGSTKSFYKIHTILRNWPDAKEACSKEGAELFYAENELEANTVLDLWKRTQPFEKIYIGVSNPTKDNVAEVSHFVTIDGRPVNETYNIWHLGEPNNSNGEEYCVILSRDGTYYDDRCNRNYAFICKTTLNSVLANAIQSKPQTVDKQEATFRKDYTYFEDTQSYYKFHTKFNNWNDAKQTCINEGASLFYAENKCEADVVLAFWKQTQSFRRVFIGASISATGIFETIDGAPLWLVYNNWLPGEPNNADGIESCVALYNDGTLRDEQCESKVPFICKKRIYSNKQSSCSKIEFNETRLIQKDYTYLEDTHSLYKIHTILQTTNDAKKICNKEGASLFYPENECEVKAVIRFWEKTQVYDWLKLGISSPIKGKFETVDGRPIWDVYYKWRPSQPDNTDNKEDCVTLYRIDASFNDDQCDKKTPFICKKKSNSVMGSAVCDKSKKYTKEVLNYVKDYTFLDDVQNLYKIHTIFQNWDSANKKCLEEGAILFYPENELEFRTLQTFWIQTQVYDELFIGLSFKNKESFETFHGQTLKGLYNKWAPGKPTITNGCVLLRRDGTLKEEACTANRPFICKKKLNLLKQNIFCNTADFDYRYSKALGKCYKFHLTPMNWTEASAACGKEQSYLAVINNQKEADFLVKVTNQVPKDGIKGNYVAGAVFLGFHKLNNTWRTITDQSLQVAGYDRWNYNQPDGGDKENCGSMFYNGELNDMGCFHKCFFICEHDTDILV